jgi:hypothetical protein
MIYNGEKIASLTNRSENWMFSCRKLKVDSCLSPCTSFNSKWIKDINIRPETFEDSSRKCGHTLKQI